MLVGGHVSFLGNGVGGACECVVEVKVVVGVANASIMALFLLFGETQVVLNVARFLIFEFCLRLLLDTGFD